MLNLKRLALLLKEQIKCFRKFWRRKKLQVAYISTIYNDVNAFTGK